jgi:electron transfer flavoprotein beta subunit
MIVACVKWTAQEPDAPADDVRFAGVSHADQAALETALLLGQQLGLAVAAVTVGPAAADRALRDALALGAASAIRVDATPELESIDVAREIAAVTATARYVLCGDYSTDRGSGSVPAFLAHHLGVAQALGLVAIAVDGGALRCVRRLDGGRREILRLGAPCVVSVEGSVAKLRRASLRAALASNGAAIDVRERVTRASAPPPSMVTPFRPRARVLPPPRGADVLTRLRELTDPGGSSAVHGETVTLAPREAAERIVAALREWGEID